MDEQGGVRLTELGGASPGPVRAVQVGLSLWLVWRVLLLVLLLACVAAAGKFILEDGGAVIFTLLTAWFAAIAMEPAVARLATRMRRGLATALVMLGVALFVGVFFVLFGQLLADQIIKAVQAVPGLVDAALDWANERFGTTYTATTALEAIGITPDRLAGLARDAASGVLGFIVSVLGAFFGLFTFLLFTFYFSADGPRLRRWVASLFPTSRQSVVVTVWSLAIEKAGGYVAARVVLAAINGATTSLFLLIIGMPYWLVLGIWTGVVAQFVPTVGTYIAIMLPTLVGLLGPSPLQGVLALAWGVAYQQVENLTIEPQISAKAVNLHPAVSFASVMFGAALFGAAGAMLAVPAAAFILALFDIYRQKYELLPELSADIPPPEPPPPVEQVEQVELRRGLRKLMASVRSSKTSTDEQ
ncbi:MAG: AI-2E family transporter [Dermatophilaceae bacterium]